MPFDNRNIPRFWHSQRTRDNTSNIFDQSTLPEYERQKHQAAGEQPGVAYLFCNVHSCTHLLLRLINVTQPQETISQDKVSKSYQTRVACLLGFSQRIAAI